MKSALTEASTETTQPVFDHACADARQGRERDLIIFPEMALTGYNIGAERIRQLAEPRDGPMMQSLRRHGQATTASACFVGFPNLTGNSVFNAAVI